MHCLETIKRVFILLSGLREVTKNNPPILLAFWPVFFVAAIGEYFNMHLLPRLEYEPKFGAIMGRLFFVTSLIGVFACASSDNRPAFPDFIVFRTDGSVKPVTAGLFYKQITDRNRREMVIQGDLIFRRLKGWHTRYPIPLSSYRRNDRQLTDLERNEPVTVFSYWAGDPDSICAIPVKLILHNVHIENFNLEKLALEYYNDAIQDNIILSSDKLTNRKYFKVLYNRQPMAIESFKLVERHNQHIGHGIEIEALFPRMVEEKEKKLKQT